MLVLETGNLVEFEDARRDAGNRREADKHSHAALGFLQVAGNCALRPSQDSARCCNSNSHDDLATSRRVPSPGGLASSIMTNFGVVIDAKAIC